MRWLRSLYAATESSDDMRATFVRIEKALLLLHDRFSLSVAPLEWTDVAANVRFFQFDLFATLLEQGSTLCHDDVEIVDRFGRTILEEFMSLDHNSSPASASVARLDPNARDLYLKRLAVEARRVASRSSSLPFEEVSVGAVGSYRHDTLMHYYNFVCHALCTTSQVPAIASPFGHGHSGGCLLCAHPGGANPLW